MSKIRPLRSSVSRSRFSAAPRQLRTRQRLYHSQKPKQDGGIFRSLPVFRYFTFFGLGWCASKIFLNPWIRTASRPQSSPGPHILAQLIDNPRLPNHEKSSVRKDRAVAEKKLLDHYPSDEYNIILDASLPGEYHYDPDDPNEDYDNIDESSASTQPVALYRVERNDLGTSKGKTVALLLYAHPRANLAMPALALKMQTVLQAMEDAGEFAINLRGETLTAFIQRGEWIESLTWRSLPRS